MTGLDHKSINNAVRPQKSFYINGKEVDIRTFEDMMREKQGVDVDVTINYANGAVDTKKWSSRKFGVNTHLSSFIGSSFLRNWKQKGIRAIKLEA